MPGHLPHPGRAQEVRGALSQGGPAGSEAPRALRTHSGTREPGNHSHVGRGAGGAGRPRRRRIRGPLSRPCANSPQSSWIHVLPVSRRLQCPGQSFSLPFIQNPPARGSSLTLNLLFMFTVCARPFDASLCSWLVDPHLPTQSQQLSVRLCSCR